MEPEQHYKGQLISKGLLSRHLYAKPSLVNEIENVKGPFLERKVPKNETKICT